ncbi:hypothetical protein NDU88_001717 [Pleurodeles waltl]|uniref:Uncharacterized protein n=1 Tax=Pleurodeles waltl TaxID=8319 RepID=A0AAV7MNG9_PLEWA|nr:hypothetical protein NDU88_001717 [Pleurodeles waltl]
MHYQKGISDNSPVGVTVLGYSQAYSQPPRLDPWYLRDKSFANRKEGGVGEGLSHQLRLKRYELRALAERHARAYALASHHQLYDVGDKAKRLLAWLDKCNQECSWVRVILTKEEATCESSESIAEAFAAYYEEVYASVSRMTEED